MEHIGKILACSQSNQRTQS